MCLKIAETKNFEARIDSRSNFTHVLPKPLFNTKPCQVGRQNTIPQVNYIPI